MEKIRTILSPSAYHAVNAWSILLGIIRIVGGKLADVRCRRNCLPTGRFSGLYVAAIRVIVHFVPFLATAHNGKRCNGCYKWL